MNESFPVTGRPDWEDISLSDVCDCIAEKRTEQAVMFATLRMQGLRNSITEIEETLNRDVNGRIIDGPWKGERTAIEKEIAELEELVASVQKEQETE